MSPCIENAIQSPSGLHDGFVGPGRDLRKQVALDAVGEADTAMARRSPRPPKATVLRCANTRRVIMRASIIALILASGLLAQTSNRALLLRPDAPEFSQPAPARCTVRLDTSKGVVDIEVTRDWSPRGADRFVNLVRYGYYDDGAVLPHRAGLAAVRHRRRSGDRAGLAHQDVPRRPVQAVERARHRRVRVRGSQRTDDAGVLQHARQLRDARQRAVHAVRPHRRQAWTSWTCFTSEYGEGPGGIRAGKQDAYFAGGTKYILENFPHLDYIKAAKVITSGTWH